MISRQFTPFSWRIYKKTVVYHLVNGSMVLLRLGIAKGGYLGAMPPPMMLMVIFFPKNFNNLTIASVFMLFICCHC